MREQLALLPELFTGHLQLTLLSLLVATVVSIPLGVAASRSTATRQVVLGVAGVIQTVPALALLAVMVPLLSAMSLQGIGFMPAFIGVTAYCVLPILFGTVTGISEVDPAMIEAARGVGMTPGQRLRIVELPLAMPTMIAGLRTSSIWCVGMATLSTPVGAPSLGNYIFGGLQTRNYTAVLVGCVAAALLAQLLDRLWQMFEVGFRRRRKVLLRLSVATFVLLYGFTGLTLVADAMPGGQATLTVGAKTFTEQYVLSEVIAQRIRNQTGLDVATMPSLGSTVAFDALREGDIDIYVDYSGTIWATIMHREEVPEDRDAVLRAVDDYLEREHGVRLVAALGFENTYALAMRDTEAQRMGIERISDLAPHARELEIGGDYEFFDRVEWEAIQSAYGLDFAEQRAMDPALMYQAAAEGNVDVISAFSTDGRIAAYDLRVLEDDRRAIPPYDAIVLASERVVREHPEALATLRALDGSIDGETMRRLNHEVDAEGDMPAEVAERFLRTL